MAKKENYKKIYESKLNKKIDKGYHIHHIDFVKSNNDILNLVALPKSLHIRYHRLVDIFNTYEELIDPILINSSSSNFDLDLDHTSSYIKALQKLTICKMECYEYIIKRNSILNNQ